MSNISDKVKLCRVSTVLNKDVKSFGKQNLLDGQEDSCWNSEKGTPQWVYLEFKNEITLARLRIQFQGGFVGRNCKIKLKSPDGDEQVEDFYPEDNNSIQTFKLAKSYVANNITLLFEESSDFFGRIVVYCIDILSE